MTSRAPFLTVVTRCYRRANMLAVNQALLAAQTDPDYEQILLVDEKGEGLHAANKRLATATPQGEYVLVLDDDDVLCEPESIALLKDAAWVNDDPPLIFFKADHAGYGLLPDARVWGKRPVIGHIGSCDFITRRDWWERHIATFGQPIAGDYHFLRAMWSERPAVVWLDRQLAAVQRVSKGKPE